jgi:hypothetical protein
MQARAPPFRPAPADPARHGIEEGAMRYRTRPPGKDLLPASANNTRQFVALALAMILAVLLIPVGVQAAQTVNAFITDPGGVNQATVDADGSLSVAGNVTVDSSTPVDVTSADDPARMAFQDDAVVNFAIGSGSAEWSAGENIPSGMRLVITHVSGQAFLRSTQKLIDVSLTVSSPGHASHFFIPTHTASGVLGARDLFVFSQDTKIYSDSNSISIQLRRDPAFLDAQAVLSISGYLIDCSVAACN